MYILHYFKDKNLKIHYIALQATVAVCNEFALVHADGRLHCTHLQKKKKKR